MQPDTQTYSSFLTRLPAEIRLNIYDYYIRDYITETISRAIPSRIFCEDAKDLKTVPFHQPALLATCKRVATELLPILYRYGFLVESSGYCGNHAKYHRSVKTSRVSLTGVYDDYWLLEDMEWEPVNGLELFWKEDVEMGRAMRYQQVQSVRELLMCLPDYLMAVKTVVIGAEADVRPANAHDSQSDGSLARMEHDVGGPVEFCEMFPNMRVLEVQGGFGREWFESVRQQIESKYGSRTIPYMRQRMDGKGSTVGWEKLNERYFLGVKIR